MPDHLHEHAADWIAASLADGLTPDERRALELHLLGCESCRALQTELTATHQMLSHDFPLAVGPASGFEARLLAGFRRREQSQAGARLQTLLAALLRLPGLRVAGVAAALVVLTGVGQLLTKARRAPVIAGEARIIDGAVDQKQIENSKRADHELALQTPASSLSSDKVVTTKSGQKATVAITNEFAFDASARQPAAFDGFINYGSSIQSAQSATSLNQPPIGSYALNGSNTYTGGTTVTAGKTATAGMLSFGSGRASLDSLATASESTYSDAQLGVTKDKVIRQTQFQPPFGKTQFQPPVDSRRPDPAAKPASLADTSSVGGRLLAQANPANPAPASTPPPVTAPAGPAPAGAPAPVVTPMPDARKLIRNASAEFEVASFEQTVAALANAAAQDGGFIDTQNSARGANGKLAGTLVVKTLPENLDRFLARLPGLGEVKNQTIKTDDITKAYFDTEARLRNSRRMEDRLLKMLDEVKGKMSEVLTVEKELARVRGDIEQMQGELKLYDSQVRLATIRLSVYEKDLHQPAAFLLRETATLALAVSDAEKTAAAARRLADSVHAQILASDVTRAAAGQTSATLRLLLPADTAPAVLAQFKALGRVENFTVQDERVAQNGSGNSNDAGPDSTTHTERAPVSLNLTIRHDEQTSRQVSLTLVAPDVGAAFERARAASVTAGADITQAETNRADGAHAQAALTLRLPAHADAAFLDGLKALGRVTNLQTRRTAENPDDGPVLVTLSIVDAEAPAQQTRVRVRTAEVERRLAEIKTQAAAAGSTVENSTFAREGDDSESAALTIRLPLAAYPGFVERVRALGEVKDFAVRRQDRPGDASAPAEIELQLFREGRVVAENAGVGATVRRTFAQGADALMWSVQMIGVALAFLAPWAALLAAAGVVWWAVRRRRAR